LVAPFFFFYSSSISFYIRFILSIFFVFSFPFIHIWILLQGIHTMGWIDGTKQSTEAFWMSNLQALLGFQHRKPRGNLRLTVPKCFVGMPELGVDQQHGRS